MTKRSVEQAVRDEVTAATEAVARATKAYEDEVVRVDAALDRRRIADETKTEAEARLARAIASLAALIPLELEDAGAETPHRELKLVADGPIAPAPTA